MERETVQWGQTIRPKHTQVEKGDFRLRPLISDRTPPRLIHLPRTGMSKKAMARLRDPTSLQRGEFTQLRLHNF